jgi:tRNA pseudouridine38-40 synthase
MTGTSGDTAPLSPEGGAVASGTVLRGTVAYDGTNFHGFAQNDGVRTVAGELVAAAQRVLGVPVTLTVAGRTDAGVHAAGQVVGLEVPAGTDVDVVRLRNSLNGLVGPEVAVTALHVAPAGFHARFDATWRSYRYRILNSPVHDPFLSSTAWWVPDELDLDAMQAAGDLLVGEHDFSSFCRKPKDRRSEPLVRRVTEVRWERAGRGGGWDSAPEADGDVVRLAISASAFCHQMVRSVTGTMVDVGRGRLRPDDVARILEAKDRGAAGNVAPPKGLCLWAVGYG